MSNSLTRIYSLVQRFILVQIKMSPASDSPPQVHSHNLGRSQFVSNCVLHLLVVTMMTMTIVTSRILMMMMAMMMTMTTFASYVRSSLPFDSPCYYDILVLLQLVGMYNVHHAQCTVHSACTLYIVHCTLYILVLHRTSLCCVFLV